MKHYTINIKTAAKNFIMKQEQQIRLLTAIYQLPDIGDRKELTAHPGEFRLRAGNYRVIYTVVENILTVQVIRVGNRGDVYKS